MLGLLGATGSRVSAVALTSQVVRVVGHTAAAVLIGGQSRRFGRSKALAEVDGVAMAELVAAALEDAGCHPVVFVGGSAQEIEGLTSTRRVHLRDRWSGQGPLGGVLTALLGLGGDVVVAACDLVDLDTDAVRAVMVDDDADVVVAVGNGRRRALARWRWSALEELLDHFADGERSLVGQHLDQGAMRLAEVRVDARAVVDHNRPDALVRAGRLGEPVTSGAGVPSQVLPKPVARVSAMVPQIDVDRLAVLLEAGSARIVDVREADEFVQGHVPGAESIPLSELSDRVGELRGGAEVYLICKAGPRSQMACEFALSQGIDVTNVDGGTSAWIRSGRPVVSEDS